MLDDEWRKVDVSLCDAVGWLLHLEGKGRAQDRDSGLPEVVDAPQTEEADAEFPTVR